MNAIIENNKQQIIHLCKQFGVKELYAFGSVMRDDFTAESDVDFVASFPEVEHSYLTIFENQLKLKEELEFLLNRQVDILIEKNITNKYLRFFINQEKKLIYAQA